MMNYRLTYFGYAIILFGVLVVNSAYADQQLRLINCPLQPGNNIMEVPILGKSRLCPEGRFKVCGGFEIQQCDEPGKCTTDIKWETVSSECAACTGGARFYYVGECVYDKNKKESQQSKEHDE